MYIKKYVYSKSAQGQQFQSMMSVDNIKTMKDKITSAGFELTKVNTDEILLTTFVQQDKGSTSSNS